MGWWVYRQLQMGRNNFSNLEFLLKHTHGRRCPGCLAGAFFFRNNTSLEFWDVFWSFQAQIIKKCMTN